jgi:hypothetical protein
MLSPGARKPAAVHDSTGLDLRPRLASPMHRDRPVLPRLSIAPLAILFLAAIAAGCGDTTVTEVAVAPTGVRCQTGLATPPSAFPADGGTAKVVVTAARECSWSLSSEASWIRVAPSSGQGESEVTVTATANDQARSRTGTVVVNDQRVSVTQEPAPCRFTLERSQTQSGSNGGRLSVSVSAQSDCSWTASSSDTWLRVLNSSRTGSAAVEIEVQGHSGDQRTGRVTIAGQTFTVVQDRYTPPAPAPSPAPAPPRPTPGPAPQPPAPAPAPRPPAPVPPAPAPAPDPKGPTTPPRPPGDRDNDDDDDRDRDGKDRKDKEGRGRRGEVA